MSTTPKAKTRAIGDPTPQYESLAPLWRRCRAACGGEKFVKAYDSVIDIFTFDNFLIPFSPSMEQAQYNFYKAEAEWPGIVTQYTRTVVGGLLRKRPEMKLSDKVPEEVRDWIYDSFGEDNSSLVAFLDEALWEELQTSRVWIHIDYPNIPNAEELVDNDFKQYKPYPVIWKAESVINHYVGKDPTGKKKLLRVIVRFIEDIDDPETGHSTKVDVLYVHEIINGVYQVRKLEKELIKETPVVNGKQQTESKDGEGRGYVEKETSVIQVNGRTIDFIPAWPLNGSFEPNEPIITPLVDKEVSLYNKLSRRNHLLYGASTYTPIITADISDEHFQEIVDSGLGTWIRLPAGGTATVLETPTAALADMDRAIASGYEEMAKLGVRMLAPENGDQSGIALDIRNASQTAQLGTLNTKISCVMSDAIAFMVNWKFNLDLTASDINFNLSADFNPTPLGADWLRLATEWYQSGLIPRSLWLQILKHNDLVPAEYDDEDGQDEILNDELMMSPAQETAYNQEIQSQNMAMQSEAQTKNAEVADKTLEIKEMEARARIKQANKSSVKRK